jgi:L-ascorbate metabolism protein UlaG (beta-lactamase superfamily)
MKKFKIGFICLLIISTIVGCSLIEIDVSENRNPVPQSILLNNHIEISSTGITRISKSDFFSSSFRIKDNGKLIYIDPLAINSTDKADYIFITHSHLDHFSIKDINKLLKSETLIICPKRVVKRLNRKVYKIKEVKPGDFIDINNNFKIEAIAAYNLNPALLWFKAHPKKNQNIGYVLTLDSVRIYHAGDTDYIPEMENIKDINLALVPIGGDNLTMNVEDASKLINQMKPEYAVPMHYDMKERNELTRFTNLVDKTIKIKVLE